MHWVVILLVAGVGLVQLPLLADAVIVLLPSANLRRWTETGLSRLLASTILVLAAVGLAAYYKLYVPELGAHAWLHTWLATYLWVVAVDNYCHAVLLRPPAESVAARRVPGFDHFCPFTMNHVWRDNFVPFYSFLGCAALGIGYATLVALPRFYDCWLVLLWGQKPALPDAEAWQSLSLLFVAALSLFQATMVLFLFQTYLMWRGWTTVDFFNALRIGGTPREIMRMCFDRSTGLPPSKNKKQGEGQGGEGATAPAPAPHVSKWQLLRAQPLLYFLLPPTFVLLALPKPAGRETLVETQAEKKER